MNLTEYANKANSTAIFSKEYGCIYTALGLFDESAEYLDKIPTSRDDKFLNHNLALFTSVGAVAGLIKKTIRDSESTLTQDKKDKIK